MVDEDDERAGLVGDGADEAPEVLGLLVRESGCRLVEKHEARDSTVRGTALAELKAMTVRTSQFKPTRQVPEKSWLYRLAKRFWFNDFGAYDGMDHARASAPAMLQATRATEDVG